MTFSVIVQSFLGHYEGAAKNRDKKILRAIDSVLKQTYQDFEIIVVADGCSQTFDIIEANYLEESKVECYLITKQKMWSGNARNFGIKKAKGDYIVYLDIDDTFGPNHLQKIKDQLGDNDWVYFPDILAMGNVERKVYLKKFQNGTSNICHKRSLAVQWNGNEYGYDDWSIVSALIAYKKNKQILTPEYYVHHIRNRFDL